MSTRTSIRGFWLTLAGAALALPAQAAVRTVPSAQYATIQAAIDAASPTDTILVLPGVYHEAIDFRGKPLTLKSTLDSNPDAPAQTILDADGLNFSAITLDFVPAPGARIEGLTIRGGRGSLGSDRRGGGINAHTSAAVIHACIITGNQADLGGGLAGYLSDITVDSCRFEDNLALKMGTNGGGGIGVIASTLVVRGSSFTLNRGAVLTRGGGLVAHTSSVVTISNCLFHANDAYYGGALANFGSTVTVGNSTFVDNSATTGRLVVGMYAHASTRFQNCILAAVEGEEDGQVSSISSAIFSADYCRLTFEWSGLGGGNSVGDPGFENRAAGSFQLAASSPAIDAGENGFLPQPLEDQVDLAQNARVVNGNVDLGAFERQDVESDEPDPVGGCCFGSSCVAVTSVQCAAEGGVFLGIDVACETLLCVSSACGADVDGSGAVDFADLVILLSQWGACPGCSADIDGSWWVDFVDVTLLLSTWGPCP